MRFTLTIPAAHAAGWRAETEARLVASGGRHAIVIGALVPLPDDLDRWVAAALHADLPPGGVVAVGRAVDHRTDKGWPMRLVDARVVVDGAVVELRVAAFYRFFEYGGVALARALGATPDDAVARASLELLATAEPDWSSEVVAIAELWEGA